MNYEPGDITFAHNVVRIYTNTGYLHYSGLGNTVCYKDGDKVAPGQLEKLVGEPVVLTIKDLHKLLMEQRYVNSVR